MLPTYGQAYYLDDDGVIKSAAPSTVETVEKKFGSALGTTRVQYGKATLSAGAVSGNAVGVRGEVNLPTGQSITGGAFLYGVQGKLVYDGTVNHADSRNCAVMAQLDVQHATLTAGYVDCLWVDLGSTATGTLSATQMIRITNTTQATPNSMLYAFGKASFLFDIASDEGSGYVLATAPSTVAGCLKVQIEGATKYIPYYTNPTGG